MKSTTDNYSLPKHLLFALLIGLLLRLICSYFNYGPLGFDDYLDGLLPAHNLIDNHLVSIPNYRSYLLVWLLAGFLFIGKHLGVANTLLTEIRCMLFGLSIFSLLAVYGGYLYAKSFKNRSFTLAVIYFIAICPFIVFASTRAYGESVSLSLVLLGLGLCESSRGQENFSKITFGLVILGMATLFRFQNGIIWVFYVAMLLLKSDYRKKIFLSAVIAAIILLLLESCIDRISHRAIFSTLLNYLVENKSGVNCGIVPWYSTWGIVAIFFLLPFTLPLFKYIKSLCLAHWQIIVPLLLFVTIHSLVPHKEERFMFPILGVLYLLLAWLWSCAVRANSSLAKIFKIFFVIIAIIGNAIICSNNIQSEFIEPLLKTNIYTMPTIVIADKFVAPWIILEFSGSQSKVVEVDLAKLSIKNYANELKYGYKQLLVITSDPQKFTTVQHLANFRANSISCSDLQVSSSFIDRIVYKLNPSHNVRMAPTMYVLCHN